MNGYVTDRIGRPIVSAGVVLVHEPSGARLTACTRSDGQFNFDDLPAGGPYTVTVSAPDLPSATRGEIYLFLNEDREIDFILLPDLVWLET